MIIRVLRDVNCSPRSFLITVYCRSTEPTALIRATLSTINNGSVVRVVASGAATQDIPRSQISTARFIGLGGDDFFRNSTNIPSQAFGNNGNDVLIGGSRNDTLVGGAGSDELRGGAGDDIIRGSNGGTTAELIFGDAGDDRLFGGTGSNTIEGGTGNDIIRGNSGNDVINGGLGNDQIFAGAGTNTIRAGSGNDQVIGGSGMDTVFGEAGIDRIFSLGGDDFIDGGAENDTLVGGQGNDTHVGGNGDDRIRTGSGNDEADGGLGNDIISGSQGNNTLNGGSGQDTILAGSGNDTVNGGGGNDLLYGQGGDDTIDGGNDSDLIVGFSGNDTLRGGGGNDRLFGGDGDDFLEGGSGNDRIVGNNGNDQLFGAAGNDVLIAGNGLDGLSGGSGSDQLTGGANADRFLNLSGDTNVDLNAADAQIIFRNSTSAWAQRELEIVDEGLRRLHIRTGGTRVFKGSLDPSTMVLFKEARGASSREFGRNALQNSFSFDTNGTILSETFTRRIEIADFDENDEAEIDIAIAATIHEISHSWDSAREINEAFAGQGFIWTRFLIASGWRTSPAGGFVRGSVTTSEPFDLVFNAGSQSFTQVTDTWYYRSGTNFARDYGSSNPKEDWATAWEAALSDDPADRVGIAVKVAEVSRLFNLL